MQFSLVAALLSIAGFAAATPALEARQAGWCPEAARFGGLVVTPSTLKGGDPFSVKANFSCSVNQYGIVPKFIDYYIVVPEAVNNGHEAPILVARREWTRVNPPLDQFNTTLPDAFYFPNAAYELSMMLTYPTQGVNNKTVYLQGGIGAGLTIAGSV